MTSRDEALALAKTTKCNCDLDNWEPDRRTGHSSVCRIHKAALLAAAPSPDEENRGWDKIDAWLAAPANSTKGE